MVCSTATTMEQQISLECSHFNAQQEWSKKSPDSRGIFFNRGKDIFYMIERWCMHKFNFYCHEMPAVPYDKTHLLPIDSPPMKEFCLWDHKIRGYLETHSEAGLGFTCCNAEKSSIFTYLKSTSSFCRKVAFSTCLAPCDYNNREYAYCSPHLISKQPFFVNQFTC